MVFKRIRTTTEPGKKTTGIFSDVTPDAARLVGQRSGSSSQGSSNACLASDAASGRENRPAHAGRCQENDAHNCGSNAPIGCDGRGRDRAAYSRTQRHSQQTTLRARLRVAAERFAQPACFERYPAVHFGRLNDPASFQAGAPTSTPSHAPADHNGLIPDKFLVKAFVFFVCLAVIGWRVFG